MTTFSDTNSLSWRSLYNIGAISAIIVILIIPLQLGIFVAWPPPDSVEGFFELFNRNAFWGLLSLDLLYFLNNSILVLFYLSLFMALVREYPSVMLVAIILGLIGITAYYSSTVAFEMLSVSQQYYATDSVDVQNHCLAAGLTLLATYKGTAFDVYYILNAVSLLLISVVMLRSKVFSQTTGYWGLASGILMLIPSTAGSLGLIFSIASLVPWIVFSIFASRRLLSMGKQMT